MQTFKIKKVVKKIVEVEEEVELTFNEFIGYQITQARKKANLSQEEVASALNKSRVNYVNMERGKVAITIERLSLLCSIFDCESSDIINF